MNATTPTAETPSYLSAVTSVHHGRDCAGCLREARYAAVNASVTGSVGSTSTRDHRAADGELVVDHAATVNLRGLDGPARAAVIRQLDEAIVRADRRSTRPTVLIGSAAEGDLEILTEAHKAMREGRYLWTGEEIVGLATAIARAVAFPDVEDRPATMRLLALVADELDDDADVLGSHEVRSFLIRLAGCVQGGNTLPSEEQAARAVAHVEAWLRDEQLTEPELVSSSWEATTFRIGWLILDDRRELVRTPGEAAAWPETVVVEPQTVPLMLTLSHTVGRDDEVAARLEATSIRRESGAQLGGVDVVRTVDETPRPTTDVARTYAREAAKSIVANGGRLFGGRVQLARGVTIAAARYELATIDPFALHVEIAVDGYERPRAH